MTFRRSHGGPGRLLGMLALGAVCAVALSCGGGTLRQAAGRTFELTRTETRLADEYEQAEPKRGSAPELCEYWEVRTRDAQGRQTVGALTWPARYFKTFREWVDAKTYQVCGEAEKQQKLVEKREAVARERQMREAAERARLEAAARAERQREEDAVRRARAQAISAEEVESGRCSDERYQQLQQAMHAAKSAMRGDLHLIGHDVVVATEQGVTVDPTAWLGGELHLFAVGFMEPTLVALDKRDYEIKVASAFEHALLEQQEHGITDSRVVQIGVSDRIRLSVRGRGCTLVLAMRKW